MSEGLIAGHLGVAGQVAARAAATPHALAVASGNDRLTYGELDRRATSLAHDLVARGARPGTLVALLLPRSSQLVVAVLAVFKARAAYVPLDPAVPAERLAFMLEDARPVAVVTLRDTADRLPRGPWSVRVLDRRQALADGDGPATDGEATPEELAYAIYTSGSTGKPKGVAVSHGGLLNLVRWHHRAFAVTARDRATLHASPGFDAAVWELWPYLAAGASLHLPDEATRLDPAALRDWMIAHAITISFLPTPLAERVMALPWPPRASLRVLLTGADTLHHYPRADLPFVLVNNYGPTEASVVATSCVVAGGSVDRLPPIGRPIDNVQVHILDERRRPVRPGAVGELYIGGAGVARGYLNRPELTLERFVPDPFRNEPGARLYRTGDLGRLLPDGQIAFVGRTDDQIKIRGFRIEPDEIVAVLDADPAVEASAVAARDGADGERRLVAYVVPASGAAPSADSLRAVLRARLPDYMVPSVFVRLDALPLTTSGKVDRAALPDPEGAETLGEAGFVEPDTLVERQLAEIVTSLLGIERVGANDNFFLLGGHSLLGTQLIARVRQAFGIELALRSLFDQPTVAALATEIERQILARLEKPGSETPHLAA